MWTRAEKCKLTATTRELVGYWKYIRWRAQSSRRSVEKDRDEIWTPGLELAALRYWRPTTVKGSLGGAAKHNKVFLNCTARRSHEPSSPAPLRGASLQSWRVQRQSLRSMCEIKTSTGTQTQFAWCVSFSSVNLSVLQESAGACCLSTGAIKLFVISWTRTPWMQLAHSNALGLETAYLTI